MSASNPQRAAGAYTLYGKIASGGMASVHFGRRAGAAGFARTVAIKRLHPHLADDPDFRSSLIDEARLTARIRHPNVVSTLDVVASEGELLVVMEYIHGESLSRLLRGEEALGRRVPLPIVSAIIGGALRGLGAAHGATSEQGAFLGLVHRDVSPQNVVVGTDGLARILDFGVAKAAGRLQMTGEGVIKGKVAYMAPEHLEGREVTAAVDIYAMGVVLWEALAGRRLFAGDDDTTLLVRVLNGVSLPPSHYAPEVSSELDAVVMKALARDPVQRFATADAMADALVRVCPPSPAPEVGRWVAQVAEPELALHALLLAEIESESSRRTAPALQPDYASHASARSEDETGTSAKQVGSAPARTPGPHAFLVAAALSLAIATFFLIVSRENERRFRDADESSVSSRAPLHEDPAPFARGQVSASSSSPATSASGSGAESSPGAASAPRIASPPPPRGSPRKRDTARPESRAPIRFADPD